MKVKLTADLFVDEIYDMDESLTDDEVSEKLWDRIVTQVVWDWERVDVNNMGNVAKDEMTLVTAKKFADSTQEDKYKLIECAINKDKKYEFTQNCLLEMLAEQKKEIRNAYDAFICDNLSQADFEEYGE